MALPALLLVRFDFLCAEVGSNQTSDPWIFVNSLSCILLKDGIFDCCKQGLIHPALWNAWCCRLILLGQVMHRLKLTWLGGEGGSVGQTAGTFRMWLAITVLYIVIDRTFPPSVGLWMLTSYLTPYGRFVMHYWLHNLTEDMAHLVLWRNFFWITFGMFVVAIATRTRKHVRSKYGIRGTGLEDFCCSLWCSSCTIAQMARHTADYDNYPGLCCSETGLPTHAPAIV